MKTAILFLLLLGPQDDVKSKIARRAEAEINKAKQNQRCELFQVFGDEYVAPLEWEPGLVPVLLEGLRTGNHTTRFHIDRTFGKVTGLELIWYCGTTFEASGEKGQARALKKLDSWWKKYKDKSRVDWLLDCLDSPSLTLRRNGIDRLSSWFNKSFEYEAEGKLADRDESVTLWRAYWKDNRRSFVYNREKGHFVVDKVRKPPVNNAKLRKQIAEWIELLAHPDIDEREKATERLIDAGASAYDQLQAAAKGDDIETRFRIEMILEAEPVVDSWKALRNEAQGILRSTERESIVATLSGQKDLKSAVLLVNICNSQGADSLAKIAAGRAARDPKIAWAFARSMRTAAVSHYGGYVPTALNALFAGNMKHLLPYMQDASPRVRMAVVGILAAFGTEYGHKIKEALSDRSKRIRLTAIRGMERSGDKTCAFILADHLRTETDWDNRRWTVLAIGTLKAAGYVNDLVKILRDTGEHTFVAGAAAEGIGRMLDLSTLDALMESIDHRTKDFEKEDDYSRLYVVRQIAGAVYKLLEANPTERKVWKALDTLFAHKSADIRFTAIQYAQWSRIKDPAIRKGLREYVQGMTDDKNERVRLEAVKILKQWR